MKLDPKRTQLVTTVVALLGIIAIMSYQKLRDDISIQALFTYNRIAYIGLGLVFVVFSVHQLSVVLSKEEWGPNRFAGAIRLPIYAALAIVLFYLAASGSTLV